MKSSCFQVPKNKCRRLHLIILLTGFFCSQLATAQDKKLHDLIAGLDSLRIQLKIPAMGIALQQGNRIMYQGALGYANRDKNLKATARTTFRVASITKTFTSTLVMQLVQAGKLSLDAKTVDYGVDLGNPAITVRHLLTHSSEGIPGSYFQYNGYRYGRLGVVLEKITGVPFYQLLLDSIIKPLGLFSTAPGISGYEAFAFIKKRKDMLPFFETAFSNIAVPYALNDKGEIYQISYLDEFGAFGGLVTSTSDLLKYSNAIDNNRFVSAKTQAEIFTPNKTMNSVITPYGLGWFTQEYKGLHYYWHYGQTPGESGIFIKVPEKQLTFVVLTNTEQLSVNFPLGDGDLFTSPAGQLLYRYIAGNNIADADSLLHNKELITRASIALVHGDTLIAKKIYDEYGRINFKNSPSVKEKEFIAAIDKIGINQQTSAPFVIDQQTTIKITGVGENCSADFSSWCDYGWIENAERQVVWQMQGQQAVQAGGAIKNQKTEAIITLQAGKYTLHYKSDGGHAYDHWDSAPPDNFFWGIAITVN